MQHKILIILTMVLSVSLFGQDISLREKALFEKGIEFYKAGNYSKAEQNFSLIVTRLPNNSFITANYLMLAKTQYKMGDYSAVLNLGERFIAKYPQSLYRDDMLFVMAGCYFRLDRPLTAVNTWLKVMEATEDQRLHKKAGMLIREALAHKLTTSEISRLAKESQSADGQMLIAIHRAEELIANGSFARAGKALDVALKNYSGSVFADEARHLHEVSDNHQSNTIRFGALLPLSGPNADLGMEVREGIEFAISKFREKHDYSIELVVRDYGDNFPEAIKNYQQLAADPAVLGVIGPLENDFSAACAAVSRYEQVPLLSPTATGKGLTALSDYFYQLSTSVDLLGASLAHYALDSLKVKRVATLAPIDRHFVNMVDSFVEVLEKHEVQVMTEEWYYPGDQDFYKQFMKIKRKGLKLAFADSVRADTTVIVSDQILDSLFVEYVKAEQEKLDETRTKLDSADIPVNSIDAILIPIYTEDMKFIAPQIAYSNIQAKVLGNKDWNDPDQLKKNKTYLEGLIFGSSGYQNEQDWDYRSFRNAWRTKLKKSPTATNIIGYDCFSFMLAAINDGTRFLSREKFQQSLLNQKKYHGIYRDIELNENRINRRTQLLKFTLGQIIPLN